ISRIDPALREAASDEIETGLWRAHIHVAQFLAIAKAPDRTDTGRDTLAEQFPHQELLALVAGREHDQIGRHHRASLEAGAFGDETVDLCELQKLDRA